MSWFPKKRIVVPIDFSDQSLAALDVALELVSEASAVHALHVMPALMVVEPGIAWTEIDDESRKKEFLAALTERTSAAKYFGLHRQVLIGDPGHEIVRLAEELEADLIVMPSHGRSGLRHLLIGSVAERVIRYAPCPVLVLRHHRRPAK